MAISLRQILAKNIKAARIASNQTQEVLAEKAKVSTSYIALLEAGKKFPSDQKLEDLALALNLKPFELLIDFSQEVSVNNKLIKTALVADFLEDLSENTKDFVHNYFTRKK